VTAPWLVGKCVEDDVDAHRERFLFGKFSEEPFIVTFSFPSVAKTGIVTDQHADAAVREVLILRAERGAGGRVSDTSLEF